MKYIFLKKRKTLQKINKNKRIQKKKDEIKGFKLLVIITFNATKDPNRYDPLSPKNIFAFGKLNKKSY